MKDIVYITDCHDRFCRLSEKEIILKNTFQKNGRKTVRYICKYHKGFIIKRISDCIQCGQKVYQKPKGTLKLYCSEKCRKAFNNHRKGIIVSQKPKPKKKKIKEKNPFNCLYFKNICGFCIMPIFICKLFKKGGV